MEPGYYIPEPEEFHIGFEFERQQIVPEYDNQWRMKVKKLVFTKEYFTSNAIRYNFFEDLKEGKIRVKSLDEEDIKSLNLTLKVTPCGEDTEKYQDIYQGESSIGSFHPNDKTNIEILGLYFTIKNKLELKILLKQLGL